MHGLVGHCKGVVLKVELFFITLDFQPEVSHRLTLISNTDIVALQIIFFCTCSGFFMLCIKPSLLEIVYDFKHNQEHIDGHPVLIVILSSSDLNLWLTRTGLIKQNKRNQ